MHTSICPFQAGTEERKVVYLRRYPKRLLANFCGIELASEKCTKVMTSTLPAKDWQTTALVLCLSHRATVRLT